MLLLAFLTPITYDFPKEVPVLYRVAVSFDGFLPVFGGQDGTAEITLGMSVQGLGPDEKENAIITSELTSAKVKYMGENLPFTVDNVRAFFPKTKVTLTPQGKTLKSDAPDVQLPIRLPGLDVKRFPDLTYLPLEFPVGGVDLNKPWTFVKKLGGSDATYTVTPTEMNDQIATFKVEVAQTETNLENEALELVKEEKDAKYRVVTVLKGTGTVLWDLVRKQPRKVDVSVVATGEQTDLKTAEKKPRALTTKLSVERLDK